MSLLQHCFGLFALRCDEWVGDHLSGRRFVGFGLQETMRMKPNWCVSANGCANIACMKIC